MVCYADKNKLSQVDPNMVTNILNVLKGNIGDIVIGGGSKHSFLFVNITIRYDIKVEINMKYQFESSLKTFGEELSDRISIPSAKHL